MGRGLWVCVVVSPSLLGCTSGVTPPGPFVAQETARSVGAGRTRLDATAGGGGGACCGWAAGGVGGQVRVRHGITDTVELGAAASAAWYAGYHDFTWVRRTGPLSVAGQADVKLTLADRMALVVNAGGGATPVGAFVTGATAVVLSRPSPSKVEPYGQIRLAFSAPVGRTGRIPDEDPGTVDPAAYVLGAAGMLVHLNDRTALAFEWALGAILPFQAGEGPYRYGAFGGATYATVGVQVTLGREGG